MLPDLLQAALIQKGRTASADRRATEWAIRAEQSTMTDRTDLGSITDGRLVGKIGLAFVVALLLPSALAAQVSPTTTSADRTQEFEALAREVALLEYQGTLLKKVVKLAQPSVVHIESEKTPYGSSSRVEEAGAGVIIVHGDKPYIVTNRHVVKDSLNHDVTVQFYDGKKVHPTKKWGDSDTDVAVMQIAATDLVPARLGNSDDLEIGDFVLAMGSPFGLSHSATFGIVSAKGRRDLELGKEKVRLQNFIQTDAAINPGNSGGPLLNLRGEVVGINTAIASNSGGNEGIGFAIPIKMVLAIAKQLINNDGEVVRAYLGVGLDRQFTQAAAAELGLTQLAGARVTTIYKGTPAEAAKLQVNDVIVKFNGVRIEDDGHLINIVALWTPVGEEVEMEVMREGQFIRVQTEVTVRPKT